MTIWGICGACGRSCSSGAYCDRCRARSRRDGWVDLAMLLCGLVLGGALAWCLMGGPVR